MGAKTPEAYRRGQDNPNEKVMIVDSAHFIYTMDTVSISHFTSCGSPVREYASSRTHSDRRFSVRILPQTNGAFHLSRIRKLAPDLAGKNKTLTFPSSGIECQMRIEITSTISRWAECVAHHANELINADLCLSLHSSQHFSFLSAF